ncbi:MAG: CocE/NonD family hydrolase [Gammaproteobacteria bacterium]|nr:CocE/NonD family hydrolase [Gammaproteobacteria bacterium]
MPCRIVVLIASALLLLVACSAGSPQKRTVELQTAWIPMPDGVRLAADLYLPANRQRDERFPVLLEYLPYRKTESRGSRHSVYAYFVDRGYVVARVDIRGTGNSEGTLIPYEYSDIELDDGEVVIDWLSKLDYANGSVGMFGISWGGFNSIQMAMRNPPALKAIVPLMATDDLFHDDVHFMDGIMHVDSWEVSQEVENMVPGAPGYEFYDRYFNERFDRTPSMQIYKEQQRDGPWWDRASLKSDYSSIKIPVYAIGGWYDGYRDSVPRMLERMDVPVKGLIGPWGHTWPSSPYPEPGMEWRHEAVRFYDRWLKGIENGIMDEPAFAVYVRDWHPPGPIDHAPGHWRWEDGWPLQRAADRTLYFGAGGHLAGEPADAGQAALKYRPSDGVDAGGSVMWWGDFMPDQAAVDASSFSFTSAPLDRDLEILGFPRALLRASASAALAHWYVRLSDVSPDGQVTQITGAGLNGAHRDSSREPKPLTPGEIYDLAVELHFTSWIFRKGHRVRVSVSNAQWPMFWPTPYQMETALHFGAEHGSRVVLPAVPAAERPAPAFKPIETYPPLEGYGLSESETVSGYAEFSEVKRDESGNARVEMKNRVVTTYPWGKVRNVENITHRVNDNDPADASVTGSYSVIVEKPGETLVWLGVVDWRSDDKDFHFKYTKSVSRGERQILEKVWQKKIARDHQ